MTAQDTPSAAASESSPGMQRQAELQQAASLLERPHLHAGAIQADAAVDPDVDRYRYIYHAIRMAPMPEPGPAFALQMERLTADHPEQAAVENWLLGLVAGLSVLAVGLFVVPGLVALLPLMTVASRALPWPMLLAAGSGLAVAWGVDRLLMRGPASDIPSA